jgi:hypothetical protein
MPAAEPSTPEPTYAIPASSNSPWMVPSSPNVPCSTGNTTSRFAAPGRVAPRRQRNAGLRRLRRQQRRNPLMQQLGSRRRLRVAGPQPPRPALSPPSSRPRASPAASQCPSLVMPIGTTSNFFRSIAFKIEAAESRETSCSPLRPPNKIPPAVFLPLPSDHCLEPRKMLPCTSL